MHFFSVPSTIQRLITSCIWRKNVSEKIIYLTFDDGPHPRITPWVLTELSKHDAKATFFCVGDNIRKFPEICEATVAAGHLLANHTMHHIKGWRTSNRDYLKDIQDCELQLSYIHNATVSNDVSMSSKGSESDRPAKKLFRPPYGQIKPSQIQAVAKSFIKSYDISVAKTYGAPCRLYLDYYWYRCWYVCIIIRRI